MRVLIVLLALVVTPFLPGASQTQTGSSQGDRCANGAVREDAEEAEDAEHEDVDHEDVEHEDVDDEDEDRGCDPTPPAPPPPAGTLAIDGTVFEAIAGSPALGAWVVELSGTATATALTDATTGRYAFTGLAPGTYTVCEVVQPGWRQTFPPQGTSCLTGVGYTFTLTAGSSASFVDFGNVRQ
jgi:hypothetical protein